MSELSRDEKPSTRPEQLDGADYWNLLMIYKQGNDRLEALKAQQAELEKQLVRHVHDPVSIPARVHLPKGSGAYLTRSNYERLPGEPEEFEAMGVEIISSNQLVFFNNRETYLWLVVDNPPSGLRIEPILPDSQS